MLTVQVSQITKSFSATLAVDDVSFTIEKGEIFALLGPNGAGKTTIIRLLLDLIKPDQGQIAILGGPMTEVKKNRIGYMPEERGLYRDVSLKRCLNYLGTLKGLSTAEARERSSAYLERFGLAEHQKKKIKDLSKGMQQKAQLIVTLMHRPELVIIDEPFTSLDPVNTQLVKGLLRELREDGTALIMSTHQMYQAEEMCDRILLIDHGRTVLYGELDEIRRRFSGHAVLVRAATVLPSIPGVTQIETRNNTHKLTLEAGVKPKDVLRTLVAQDVDLEHFAIAIPTLAEIFIQVVQGREGTP